MDRWLGWRSIANKLLMNVSAQAVRLRAAELGFNLVGITPAAPSPRLDAYFRWIDAAMHGTMGYMAREDRQARRRDLNVILPGVRSLIVVGLDYHALSVPADVLTDPGRGRIAAYAWGHDYHDLIAPRLEALAEWLSAIQRRTVGASRLRRYGRDSGTEPRPTSRDWALSARTRC